MANSLRAKLKKLNYEGKITDEELNELLDKLDGHNKEVKKQAVEFTTKFVVDLISVRMQEVMKDVDRRIKKADGEERIRLIGVHNAYFDFTLWLKRLCSEVIKCLQF